MDVFISHITEESAIAVELQNLIERKFLGQIQVFVSSTMLAGSNWLNTISSKLCDCNVLLVICSPGSLARPWINFEIGCGWMKKIPIIPICHSEQRFHDLPLPLSEQHGLDLEDVNFVQSLLGTLARHFDFPSAPTVSTEDIQAMEVAKDSVCSLDEDPQIIYSPRERTQLIVNDLNILQERNQQFKTIWTSSFLSALAIDEDDDCSEEDHLKLLLEERDQLLNLARSGCKVKCIISPANKNYIRHAGIPFAIKRTKRLLEYLQSEDESLLNIDFAISEYGTKNLYLIDNLACYEGYKNCLQYGYALTLRQKSPEIMKITNDLYEKNIFPQLANRTIQKWANKEAKFYKETETLQLAAIKCLEASLEFLSNYPASNFDMAVS